jgi:hypothetical protein
VRGVEPPRGAVLRLESVDLPASDHTSPDDGTRLAMTQRRRDNIARRCWRLVYADGTSARVGLFVGIEAAEEYVRDHGWTIRPDQLDDTQASG